MEFGKILSAYGLPENCEREPMTPGTVSSVWRIRTEALAAGDSAGVCVTWGEPSRFRFNSVAFYA